jgi:hypothetical protein
MLTKQDRIKIAKARSFINRMANGHELSEKAFQYTVQIADEYGDDAIWQQGHSERW